MEKARLSMQMEMLTKAAMKKTKGMDTARLSLQMEMFTKAIMKKV
jgi:hypothetical protein